MHGDIPTGHCTITTTNPLADAPTWHTDRSGRVGLPCGSSGIRSDGGAHSGRHALNAQALTNSLDIGDKVSGVVGFEKRIRDPLAVAALVEVDDAVLFGMEEAA